MITATQLATLVQANLNDVRMNAITVFIAVLLERKTHGGDVGQYRIKNTVTGEYIKTLDEFISGITPDTIRNGYYRNADKMCGDIIHPTVVTLTNYVIELSRLSEEDASYFSTYGHGTSLSFLMNYMNDGDEILPLKIYEVKLH